MKNNYKYWTLFLFASLFIGRTFAQNYPYNMLTPPYFELLTRGNRPVHWISTSNPSMVKIADTIVCNLCGEDYFDPFDADEWSTSQCIGALQRCNYFVRVYLGNNVYQNYTSAVIQCNTFFIDEDDNFVNYEWRFAVSDPDYNPWANTGLAPLTIVQPAHVYKVGKNPIDANGILGDTAVALRGHEIYYCWSPIRQYFGSQAGIEAYLDNENGSVPTDGEDCWKKHKTTVQYSPTTFSLEKKDCYKLYQFDFNIEDEQGPGYYYYRKLVKLPPPPIELECTSSGETGREVHLQDTMKVNGCSEEDAPKINWWPFLEDYGLKVNNIDNGVYNLECYWFRNIDQHVEDNKLCFTSIYHIVDNCECEGSDYYTVYLPVKVTPFIKVTNPNIKYLTYSSLEDMQSDIDPAPYTTIDQLKKNGMSWEASCNNITVEYERKEIVSTNPLGYPLYKRYYKIALEDYPDLFDYAYQYIKYEPKDPQPFDVEVEDADCDHGGKGTGKLVDSNTDEGCPTCRDNSQLWYKFDWHNNTKPDKSTVIEYHADSDVDIWGDNELYPGKYTLKVFAMCEDFPDATEPIWEYDCEVKEPRDEKVDVRAVLTLWSTPTELISGEANNIGGWGDRLVVYVHDVCGYDQGPDEEWDDTRTYPQRRMSYEWKGRGASPGYWGRPKDFGILVGMTEYEYWNLRPQMSYFWSQQFLERMDHKIFDGRLWEYHLQRGRNDLRVVVDYIDRDETKWQRDHADFTVYYKNLCNSNDPNELYGPEGYDTVHFINATDPITYTVMYENDPEFATAPASRVQITCPLDDKGIPNTFSLGTFGFGEYTFEVPPASAHYSNRIDLSDSLGVWLDVVAGIQVPENYAYWIFQSIDPATGLQPSGSIGFLPVNDTLEPGNGEGYVTFSISPRTDIVTGDEISEQASIVFDQNDTVPTNIYTNRFDAVAPVSTLHCDTTDVYSTGILPLTFTASDDENGSGVNLVNVYVNIDGLGYEQVGTTHPDSTFNYVMGMGSQFEFLGCAVDNVDNKEEFKLEPEFTFVRGSAPTDIRLSASTFDEDASLFTVIGNFSTTDDQTSNVFLYSLVDGEGSDHNALFNIVGNSLITDNDFRCYGLYDYSIRVRSVDLSDQYIEKVFSVHALQNMTPEITTVREYLCPSQSYYFAGEYLTQGGVYYDTLETVFGCDSIVRLVLDDVVAPVTTEYADAICFGEDYFDNGFNLSVDTLAQLTAGWTMEDDIVLTLDRYTENYYGCYDTTRLNLTLHPAFYHADVVSVCATELPYVYREMPFYTDTVALFSYPASTACDSTFALQLTVRPEETQTEDFAYGWNWFSLYIDQSNGQGLANLENALSSNAVMIKSRTQFTNYDPGTGLWFGNLLEMDNKSMYMVKMNNPNAVSQSGCSADVDTITLRQGWNWIGYPMTDTTYVNQLTNAIGGGPANYDLIKSKTAFSIYDADYGFWYGSLNVLTSGVGYMYKSNSSNQKPLYYPNRSRQAYQPLDIPVVHWEPDHAQFFSNMTLTGVIWLDGQRIDSDTLEVGAFVNGEQRGSGRAVYIEQLDAYRVFLLIHGEEGDVVNFRLFNHNRDKERRIRCNDLLTFHADNNYGTLDTPYAIDFLTDYDTFIQAEICEGDYYMDNGFRVNHAGTYFQELTTPIGNDSIVRLDLSVNPVYHVEEEVVAVEFPFVYQGLTFSSPGTYMLDFNTAAACDSVWVINVIPYEGQRELLISPLPAMRDQRVSLYYPFTQKEQQDVVVEVYTLTGSLVQSCKPTRFPIELDPFTTSGTYMLKITMGTGEVLSGKIIVK